MSAVSKWQSSVEWVDEQKTTKLKLRFSNDSSVERTLFGPHRSRSKNQISYSSTISNSQRFRRI